MSIEAIAALGTGGIAPLDGAATTAQGQTPGASFESLLNGLQGLNSQMLANESAVSEMALGRGDNLHQVIMNSERTRLDFELMLAVRNKALEAYQELMRMQV